MTRFGPTWRSAAATCSCSSRRAVTTARQRQPLPPGSRRTECADLVARADDDPEENSRDQNGLELVISVQIAGLDATCPAVPDVLDLRIRGAGSRPARDRGGELLAGINRL